MASGRRPRPCSTRWDCGTPTRSSANSRMENNGVRRAHMPRRRELAQVWADMLSEGLPHLGSLTALPVKAIDSRSRRSFAPPAGADFRFPTRRRAAI